MAAALPPAGCSAKAAMRLYVGDVGRLNQAIARAAQCGKVVAAGLSLELKGSQRLSWFGIRRLVVVSSSLLD